jgi:glycosyltransferase involved in cell wall biosynthesis
VSGNLGLGVTARQVAALILSKGFPLAVLDIDPGAGRGDFDHSFHEHLVSTAEALPHSINLFVLSPGSLCAIAESPAQRFLLLKPDRIQSALLMWEHTTIPRRWLPTLQRLDMILAASTFVQEAFATRLDGVLTILALFPGRIPQVLPSRQHFGLPPEALIFVTSFEPRSDPERKNPLAAVEAFVRAFPADARTMLVIKVNNPMGGSNLPGTMLRLREASARDPRIRIIEEQYSYEQVLTLYAACDVFVSLHRSEGFGLGLIEAMALGKPVIATAWSGNMTFMNSLNSCLVGYRLVPVKATHHEYSKRLLGRGAVWADPDIADAAAWMTRLARDASLRVAIGSSASAWVAAHEKEAERGAFLDEIVTRSEQLPHMPSYQRRKERLPAWERELVRGDKRRARRESITSMLSKYRWSIKRLLGRRS